MKCNEVELMIQDNDITIDVITHLKSCEACQLYMDLFQYSPVELEYESNIQRKIDLAFVEANQIKKKHDILSLLLFIVIAGTLLSSLVLSNIGDFQNLVKQYVFILSGLMPFTLPLIALARRKAANHDT